MYIYMYIYIYIQISIYIYISGLVAPEQVPWNGAQITVRRHEYHNEDDHADENRIFALCHTYNSTGA